MNGMRSNVSDRWFQRVLMSRIAGFAIFASMLLTAGTLAINSSAPTEAAGNPCGDCTSGWQSFDSALGGRECSHGPDADDDCNWWNDNVGFGAGCCETEKNKKYTVGGTEYTVPDCTDGNACECFACEADKCEGENLVWVAHCGFRNSAWGAGQDCPLEPAGNGPRRKNRLPDPPPGGFSCDGAGTDDGTNDYEKWYACGGDFGVDDEAAVAKCFASNCPPSSQPWIDRGNGPRNKCK